MRSTTVHTFSTVGVLLMIAAKLLLFLTFTSFGQEVCNDVTSLLQVGVEPSLDRRDQQALLDVDVSPVGLLHIPYDHIAVNKTYNNLGEQLLTFPERRPREFNIILATVKTWLADAVVQLIDIRRLGTLWKFDWQRSAAFLLFGFVYVGLVEWLLYITIMTAIFPDALVFANSPWAMKLQDSPGQIQMAGQVILDNLCFAPLVYFPVFYSLKSVVQCKGSIPERMQSGLLKYWANVWSDNVASCVIWIPADLFIFACPMYMRMPLEHGVSFGWTMIISFMRGAATPKPSSKLEGAAPAKQALS